MIGRHSLPTVSKERLQKRLSETLMVPTHELCYYSESTVSRELRECNGKREWSEMGFETIILCYNVGCFFDSFRERPDEKCDTKMGFKPPMFSSLAQVLYYN